MIQTLKKVPNSLIVVRSRIKFPERFKGTIIEKWAGYWKNLYIDYGQMLKDLRSDVQDDPKKALMWTAGLFSAYLLNQNNPDEAAFKGILKKISNEVILVSEDCRNSESMEHLRYLESSCNEGVICYQSLGIASIMYISDSENNALYKNQCSYLKPRFYSFPSRIVDVGFMGQWWNMYRKMANYDVVKDL